MDNLYVDNSAWAAIRITGADRVRFLNGLTTIHVPRMVTGDTHWGAMLNPKGRVMSIFELRADDNAFTLRCEPSLTEKTVALLTRYAVMDEVEFVTETEVGYRVWQSPAGPWTARFVAGEAPGPTVAWDSPAAKIARTIAGFMSYGVDVGEDCFPFETPLAVFLDYEKGCYVGQEPVFRVHTLGNASRLLRVVHIAGDDEVAPATALVHTSRSNAGVITSPVRNGDHWLALAYVHRTVLDQPDGFSVAGRTATLHEPAVA